MRKGYLSLFGLDKEGSCPMSEKRSGVKPKLRIVEKFKFSAAHRLTNADNDESNLHGHNWAIYVVLSQTKESKDIIISVKTIRDSIAEWIKNNLEHTTIIASNDLELKEFLNKFTKKHMTKAPFVVGFDPTCDNLAAYLLTDVFPKVVQSMHVEIVGVMVYETPAKQGHASLDGGHLRIPMLK